MRIWTVLIVLIIVGVVIGGGYYWQQKAAAAKATTVPTDTYTDVTSRGDLTQSVESTGQVADNQDISIKCLAGGEVKVLPFPKPGARVKKGDLLIQIDPIDEQRALDQSEANLEQAQAKLVEAQQIEKQSELDLQTATEQAAANLNSAKTSAANLRAKANRQKELLSQKLASQEDFETAETDAVTAETSLQTAKIAQEQLKSQAVVLEQKKEDIKLAEAAVKQATSLRDEAKQQVDYTTVTAPIDGVLTDVQITPGTVISSTTSTVGGATEMTLSDMSRIFVNASVDESDIGGIKEGQTVKITADSYPNELFWGKVVIDPPTGTTSSNVVTFSVQIEVTSDNKSLLKPPMTANVQIIEAQKKDVIMVPMLAVIRRGKDTYVTIVKPDGSQEDRKVEVGIIDSDTDMQEVISGLSGGESVLVHRNESSSKWTAPLQQRGAPGGRGASGGGGASGGRR